MSYSDATEASTNLGYIKNSQSLISESEWISDLELEWILRSDTPTEDAVAFPNASDGIAILKVSFEDESDSSTYNLYYSYLLNISSDPWAETDTGDFGVAYATFNIDYTPAEKDILLSKYQRFADYAAATGSSPTDVIESSVSDLINATLNTMTGIQGAMNFKKSPSMQLSSRKLYTLSDPVPLTYSDFTGSAATDTTSASSTAATTSVSGLGGY